MSKNDRVRQRGTLTIFGCLAVLAEEKQELLEVFLIPAAASLVVPMSFPELYMTMCYTIVSVSSYEVVPA